MHHTKTKADVGLVKVIADLVSKGYTPCIPLSEHQPYDLVVVLNDKSMVRVQVKYSSLKKNGIMDVKCRTSWADKNGVHTRHYQQSDFDFYAIFCPEEDKVIYISNTPHCPKSIRFEKTGNHQVKGVKWASACLDMKRKSSETIRRTPEMAKT